MMAVFPIYGVFEGDHVPQLVAVDTTNSMAEVADAVAVHSVGRRVALRSDGKFEVLVADELIPMDRNFGQVVAEKTMDPLDFVTVRYAN